MPFDTKGFDCFVAAVKTDLTKIYVHRLGKRFSITAKKQYMISDCYQWKDGSREKRVRCCKGSLRAKEAVLCNMSQDRWIETGRRACNDKQCFLFFDVRYSENNHHGSILF